MNNRIPSIGEDETFININEYINNCNEAFTNQNIINLGINLRLIADELCNFAVLGSVNGNIDTKLKYIRYNKIIEEQDIALLDEIRYLGNKTAHASNNINANDYYVCYTKLADRINYILSSIGNYWQNNQKIERIFSSYADEANYKKIKNRSKLVKLYFKFAQIFFLFVVAICGFGCVYSLFVLESGSFYVILTCLPVLLYIVIALKPFNIKEMYKAEQRRNRYCVNRLFGSFGPCVDYSVNWDEL